MKFNSTIRSFIAAQTIHVPQSLEFLELQKTDRIVRFESKNNNFKCSNRNFEVNQQFTPAIVKRFPFKKRVPKQRNTKKNKNKASILTNESQPCTQRAAGSPIKPAVPIDLLPMKGQSRPALCSRVQTHSPAPVARRRETRILIH